MTHDDGEKLSEIFAAADIIIDISQIPHVSSPAAAHSSEIRGLCLIKYFFCSKYHLKFIFPPGICVCTNYNAKFYSFHEVILSCINVVFLKNAAALDFFL